MYFHHPWYLAALPLVLAPVVFHLLALRRAVAVRFAWTHLVRRALQHSSARRKLVDRIVLAVRCLLIAACLLYFARPVGYVDPAARGRVRLTIAVDTSLSMRRRGSEYPVFPACVERVDRLLQLLEQAGMQVQVVAFDTAVRSLTAGSVGAAQARAAVATLSAGWLGTDAGALLQWWTARTAAQDSAANERLHHKLLVLTDGAAHGVRTPLTLHTGTSASKREVLFWHPPLVGTNGRVTDVFIDVGEDGVVAVRCGLAGVPVGAQVQLAVDGQPVDALAVNGTSDWYAFTWHPRDRRGDAALEIRLPDDVLPDDDVFRCVYRCVPRRQLFCRVEEALDLRGVDSIRFYLDRLEGAGWEVVYSPGNEPRRAPPGSLDLRVGMRTMPVDESAGGHPVLVFPAVDADTDSYERFAEGIEFVEVRRPVPAGVFGLIYGQDEDFNAFCAQYDLRNIAVFRTWRVTITAPASGWRPVLYFNDGTPAMVARGSVWLSAFPLDRASTNLVLKPFFIGLLRYVAATAGPARIIGAYELVGSTVPLGGRSSITRYPDGGAVLPDSVSLASDGVCFLKPGWYRVGGEGSSTIVGVNTDPREGDLTPASAPQLRGMLRAAGADSSAATRVFRDGDVSEVAAWCLGREYTEIFAVGMALLFVAETALSRLGRRVV